MGKSRRKVGPRKPKGRYITTLEEMNARNEQELKAGKPVQGTTDNTEGDNSDADLISGGEEEVDEVTQRMKDIPRFVPDAPLSSSSVLETANPNDLLKRNVKLKDLKDMAAPELSRKEREFVETQQAERDHQRMTALGQTEESKSDLSRLAEIRKERERAKQRREAELAKKEELKAQASQRAEAVRNKVQKKQSKKKRK